MKFIPQIEPWIGDDEVRHVTDVVRSTYVTENAKTEEFLDKITQLTGAPYAIATSNGTLAIVASLIAEGVGPGDEIVVPDLTFIASANAVRLVGATPVFCDVDGSNGCMTRATCEAVLTPRTRGIMPVHLYGHACDMQELCALAQDRNLIIFEDAAEALGVRFRGKHVGTFGEYGMFSFFANKVVTCGEGGVILTDSEARYKKLFRVKNHGRDRKGIFVHDDIGYNFCFTDLQAALGVAQLERFDEIMRRKAANYEYYRCHLRDIPGVRLMEVSPDTESNYWFVNILVPDPVALGTHLQEAGIGTRRMFYPMTRQPCYGGSATGAFPVAREVYESGLSLPSSPLLTDADRERICAEVRAFYA